MNETRLGASGPEMRILVDGVYQWRSYHIETDSFRHTSGFLSSVGRMVPDLAEHEHFVEIMGGESRIVSGQRVIQRIITDGIRTKDGCA